MSATSKAAVEELWLAVGHVRAAKTKLADARNATRPLPPAVADLLRLEARELWKLEQKLIRFARAEEAGAAT